jgi:hypothetical protein
LAIRHLFEGEQDTIFDGDGHREATAQHAGEGARVDTDLCGKHVVRLSAVAQNFYAKVEGG